MAARLKTRLSAGAALVTGLGMMGVATALPAQAAATVTYTCTVDGTSQDIDVTFDTNAPGSVAPGETLTVDSVTGAATIPLADAPSPSDAAEVTAPVTAPVTTGGRTTGTVDTTLSSEDITVGAGDVQVSLASHETQSIVVPVEAAGQTFEVLVPESFEATLSGFTEGGPITVPCSTTMTDTVIDTVEVTSPEMDEGSDDAEDTSEVHDPADEQPPAAEAPSDSPAEKPAVPQVVQTDGLTPRMLPQEDNTLGYALGGLLLAGAGAGTVLVARRRSTQH